MTDNKDTSTELAPSSYKLKLHDGYFVTLAEFIYEMNIDCSYFVDSLKSSFSQVVISRTENSSDFFLEAGFPISTSRKLLTGHSVQKQNTIESFFQDVVEKIKEYAEKSDDMTLKIKSNGKCFNKAIYSLNNPSNSIAASSMLTLMIKRGIVEQIDDNTIKFISAIPHSHLNSQEKMAHLYGHVNQRLSSTLIHNIKTDDDDLKYFQQTFRSIHIHPSKHTEVNQKLMKLVRKHWLEYQELIDSYEEETELGKKIVENLGVELGISTFTYSINPNEEKS
jgi:DNA-binding transcriptional MerR regulator